MSLSMVITYAFVLLAASAAIGILMVKNILKAALLLMVCLLSVAGLYIMAFAEFVGVVQILIYAGGVVLLIVFGIMLTSRILDKPLVVSNSNVFIGAVAGFGLFALMTNIVAEFSSLLPTEGSPRTNSLENIGVQFMSTHIIPFEVAGLLLLMALVGAGVATSFLKEKKVR